METKTGYRHNNIMIGLLTTSYRIRGMTLCWQSRIDSLDMQNNSLHHAHYSKGTNHRIMLSEYLTLTGASEDVVEPPIMHVIQYPTSYILTCVWKDHHISTRKSKCLYIIL